MTDRRNVLEKNKGQGRESMMLTTGRVPFRTKTGEEVLFIPHIKMHKTIFVFFYY